MNILKKIMTAIRGGTREIGEAIVDTQGTRIFAQEIEDAKESLNKAKHDLTEVMAKEMQAGRKVKSIEEEVAKNEGFIAEALEKGEDEIALEIAGKVAVLESEKIEYDKAKKSYSDHVVKLKTLMESSERQLAEYERQLTMVKTTENVQKATAAITDNFSSTDSTLMSAKDSLERIRQKQEDFNDRFSAAEELEKDISGVELEEKMQQAGIGGKDLGAQAVLERIKNKNK